jgi:hypothetical protein
MRASVLVLAALLVTSRQTAANGFDPKTADFAVSFKGEASAYRDTSVFMLPGETLTFEAVDGAPGTYALKANVGIAVQQTSRKWRFTAPDRPGLYTLQIDGPTKKKDTIDLHVFVMVPASRVRNGWLNGYEIGAYPPPPANARALYAPPRGFVEVTEDNEDTKVSPHFRLKQFICKEDTTRKFPKYVVLQERLLLKLEAILERVNRLGYDVDTLHVMSAYRTPFYNHAIGDVRYSMHQFGGASDVYVDRHKKDRMDDLNRDGRVDIDDAKFLYDRIEELLAESPYRKLEGGLGFYPATAAHPPFVHVDVRGAKARWKG